jgi:sentrin-specific protease 7
LFDRLEVPKDQVYFFNTYFYSRLTNVKGQKIIDYEAVKSWTKREDIFGYDYIVVPINEGYASAVHLTNTY